ncbi:MAG: glycoside hydrolase family 13 protein [Bacteroidota bacterium]
MKKSLLLLLITSIFYSCEAPTSEPISDPDFSSVPNWAKEAIWYQIFVERFRNGDPSNDPTIEDIIHAYPDSIPSDWKLTPWSWDWYKPDPYFAHLAEEQLKHGFGAKSQLRRYGGDLQGVLDQLEYLEDLGINAIYFNPLNDGPSLHKYDPRQYRHLDRNFGPDPQGDQEIVANENPADPNSWQWTSADQLFLKIISEAHKKGIKVILDYSWNHTGRDFWALHDVRKKGANSPFKDWYQIKSYDDPNTDADEFDYESWFGATTLPVLKKDTLGAFNGLPFEGNLHSESLKAHIFAVTERWLDPNGDGNPEDGIDGFRLDVAAEVPLGFWREYRKVVKSVNPEAYLVGEVWWDEWPDKLMDPRPFLQGDVFDAIMNYRWFRKTRGYLSKGGPILSAEQYVKEIDSINRGIETQYTYAMMNVAASHDSPRLLTSLANKNKYKYNANPAGNPDYIIHKPDAETDKIQSMLLLQQFTYPGAPHIWNGDEFGMWGCDDPNCRKPLIWPDMEFEDEVYHQEEGMTRPVDKVEANMDLLSYYKSLSKMRKANKALALGSFDFVYADDETDCIVYKRSWEGENIYAVFNPSKEEQEISFAVLEDGNYSDLLDERKNFPSNQKQLRIKIPAQTGMALKK